MPVTMPNTVMRFSRMVDRLKQKQRVVKIALNTNSPEIQENAKASLLLQKPFPHWAVLKRMRPLILTSRLTRE